MKLYLHFHSGLSDLSYNGSQPTKSQRKHVGYRVLYTVSDHNYKHVVLVTTLNTANTPNVICHCCAAGEKLNIKIFLFSMSNCHFLGYTHPLHCPPPKMSFTWPLTLKIKCLILLLAGDENLYFHRFAT